MRTLFLHIGLLKTGTTAIQNFCKTNAAALQKHGLCYPYRFLGYPRVRHHHRMSSMLRRRLLLPMTPRVIPTFEYCVAGLKKEVTALPDNCNVLISSETFCFLTPYPDVLATMHRELSPLFDSIKIIVYLRRQDEALLSTHAEWIKSYYAIADLCTLDSIRLAPFLNDGYDTLCDRWGAAFGKENIIVRPYERNQLPDGDVVNDLLQVVGLERSTDFKFPAQTNLSLPNKALEFKCLVNTIYIPESIQHAGFFPTRVVERLAKEWKNDAEPLTPADRVTLLDRYAAGNERVAREYLGRADGVLFTKPLPDPAAPFTPYTPLDANEILRIFNTLRDIAPYRALWLLARIREGLRSEDPPVHAAAERMAGILKTQRLPWLLPLFSCWGLKSFGIFKLPGLKQLLRWSLGRTAPSQS